MYVCTSQEKRIWDLIGLKIIRSSILKERIWQSYFRSWEKWIEDQQSNPLTLCTYQLGLPVCLASLNRNPFISFSFSFHITLHSHSIKANVFVSNTCLAVCVRRLIAVLWSIHPLWKTPNTGRSYMHFCKYSRCSIIRTFKNPNLTINQMKMCKLMLFISTNLQLDNPNHSIIQTQVWQCKCSDYWVLTVYFIG